MYRVVPSLIARAATVRTRCLELGGLNEYHGGTSAPCSSTLIAAEPSATNVYAIAFGEREGLAPGERLEAYGGQIRLLRALAYGCPRGVTVESAYTGRLSPKELDDITDQLGRLSGDGNRGGSAVSLLGAAGDAYNGAPAPTVKWRCTPTDVGQSAVMQNTAPSDAASCSDEGLRAQIERMRKSDEELVIAEWVAAPSSELQRAGEADSSLSTHALPASSHTVVAKEDTDALLIENGICFSSPGSCGLRCLRGARLNFLSAIERTANGGVWRRKGDLSGSEPRPLAILDVSAIDFTFTQAALQSTLELGMHSGADYNISFVPLNSTAAAKVEPQTASYVQAVMDGPGRAFDRPFEYLPTRHFDVGAYAAYLSLPTDSTATSASNRRRYRGGPARGVVRAGGSDRRQLAIQLSQALATLRRGASMIVSFVPTPSSAAALYNEVESQQRAEVQMEFKIVAEAKACVAEAISRTGRWGFIVDEVLPAVDCAQGSSYCLTVIIE